MMSTPATNHDPMTGIAPPPLQDVDHVHVFVSDRVERQIESFVAKYTAEIAALNRNAGPC